MFIAEGDEGRGGEKNAKLDERVTAPLFVRGKL